MSDSVARCVLFVYPATGSKYLFKLLKLFIKSSLASQTTPRNQEINSNTKMRHLWRKESFACEQRRYDPVSRPGFSKARGIFKNWIEVISRLTEKYYVKKRKKPIFLQYFHLILTNYFLLQHILPPLQPKPPRPSGPFLSNFKIFISNRKYNVLTISGLPNYKMQ